MLHSKCKKMRFSSWVDSEFQLAKTGGVLFCAVFCTVAFVFVRIWSGTPYQMILNLGIDPITPPVWLMTVLRGTGFFSIGAATGIVLTWKERGCDREKYRGSLVFVLLMLLELLWYPTLFRSGLLFLAMVESVCILCLSVTVTASYIRVSKLSALLFFLHDIWLAYLLIFTCAIFFHT